MARRLDRRTFLRGLGGTVVSLPFLEAMRARAEGNGTPCRFVFCFSGVSTGLDRDSIVPDDTGPLTLTRGLAPLGGRDIGAIAPALQHNALQTSGLEYDSMLDSFSVVSGLKIPWKTGSEVPPAGRPVEFHNSPVGVLLSGVRAADGDRAPTPRGPSADQVVADAIAGETDFASLAYRVAVTGYKTGRAGDDRGRMSYRRAGDGSIVPNPPIVQPSVAFDALFNRPGFVPDGTASADAARRGYALDRDVASAVHGAAQRLRARLGRTDQQRLEQYFDELQALQRRLSEIPQLPAGACALPDRPTDPELEFTPCMPERYENPDWCDRYPYEYGWADEDARASALFDTIHMAFACDLSRVASVQFTFNQSALSAMPICGINDDLHGLGHTNHGGGLAGISDNVADAYSWHVKHLARFVAKLKATPDGVGTLYDNTVVVFVVEGGWGYDPEGDRQAPHSTENMTVLVAGRPAQLQMGQHIRAVDEHPGSVVVAAMNAIGVEGGLGEVGAPLGALLR